MLGILKMLFYSFVAVVVGVFIGTVPVGGRTIADRIVSAYESSSPSADRAAEAARSKLDGGRKAASKAKPVAKAEPRARPEAAPATKPAQPAKPLTAGAANSPDRHTDEERLALDRVIASRSSR